MVRKNVAGLRVVSEEKDGEHLYGVVSFDGSSIVDCKYKYLGDPYEQQILFAEGGEWHSQGEKRDALLTADRRRRWLVNARWGIISTQEKILVPASYEYIYRPLDGVSIIVQDHKYGFYNYEDQLFFIPRYDFLEAFSEGLCVVGKIDENSGRMLYGYINKHNKEVIPCKYLKAFHFKDGEADVETENAYCVIDMADQIKHYQDKEELTRWRAKKEQAEARAEEEGYNRRQMIEDGLREAYNGDMSNRWNND